VTPLLAQPALIFQLKNLGEGYPQEFRAERKKGVLETLTEILEADKYSENKGYYDRMDTKLAELSVSDVQKLREKGPARLRLLRELRDKSRSTAELYAIV
jgi:hypothetical protein